MNFIKEKNRIYSINSEGQVIAEIVFVEEKKGVFNIRHTFVDKSLRGQRIASKLVEEAVKEIKNILEILKPHVLMLKNG